jgi:hypothetical protein
MRSLTTLGLAALALAALAHVHSARGQGAPSAPPKRAPLASPADVEPAVDVSEPRVALIDGPPPRAAAPAPAASPPAAPAASAASGPAAQKSSAAAQRTPSKPPASKPTSSPAPNSRAMDTLDLGTTSITGNQELPKVLYIVPWKKSDLGDLVGRPVNTLLDEVLEPVDPEVFQRHLSYYDALYGNGQKGKE